METDDEYYTLHYRFVNSTTFKSLQTPDPHTNKRLMDVIHLLVEHVGLHKGMECELKVKLNGEKSWIIDNECPIPTNSKLILKRVPTEPGKVGILHRYWEIQLQKEAMITVSAESEIKKEGMTEEDMLKALCRQEKKTDDERRKYVAKEMGKLVGKKQGAAPMKSDINKKEISDARTDMMGQPAFDDRSVLLKRLLAGEI